MSIVGCGGGVDDIEVFVCQYFGVWGDVLCYVVGVFGDSYDFGCVGGWQQVIEVWLQLMFDVGSGLVDDVVCCFCEQVGGWYGIMQQVVVQFVGCDVSSVDVVQVWCVVVEGQGDGLLQWMLQVV